MEQRWRHQHSPLADQVVLILNSFEVIYDQLVYVQLCKQLLDLLACVVFVVQLLEQVDVVYHEGSEVSCPILGIPTSSVQHGHEIDQTLVEDVEFVLRKQCHDRKSQAWFHLVELI